MKDLVSLTILHLTDRGHTEIITATKDEVTATEDWQIDEILELSHYLEHLIKESLGTCDIGKEDLKRENIDRALRLLDLYLNDMNEFIMVHEVNHTLTTTHWGKKEIADYVIQHRDTILEATVWQPLLHFVNDQLGLYPFSHHKVGFTIEQLKDALGYGNTQ